MAYTFGTLELINAVRRNLSDKESPIASEVGKRLLTALFNEFISRIYTNICDYCSWDSFNVSYINSYFIARLLGMRILLQVEL